MRLFQLSYARTTKRLSRVTYTGVPVTDCRMELVGGVGLDFLITLGFCIFLCNMFETLNNKVQAFHITAVSITVCHDH